MTTNAFGDIVYPHEVEAALVATLKFWMDTHLREAERRNGLDGGALPSVRSWRAAELLANRFPEQQIPAVQLEQAKPAVISTRADSATASFTYSCDIVVQSVSYDGARKLAGIYGYHMGLILLQNTQLDKSVNVEGLGWTDLGVKASSPGDRCLALGTAQIDVTVSRIASPLLGPNEPAPLPDAPPGDFPAVTSTNLDVTLTD